MRDWVVARVRPCCEVKAAINIKQQAGVYYLPQYFDHRLARRRVLFPGYIFANIERGGQWRWLNGTRGVLHVITNNERPSVIDPSVIERFRAQENDNGVIAVDAIGFDPGQSLRIKSGPYAQRTVIYAGQSVRDRVNVLLQMLGREVVLAVQPRLLEAV